MQVYKKVIFLFGVKSCFYCYVFFFFSSRRRHTRCGRDWSSDVCSSDLTLEALAHQVVIEKGLIISTLDARRMEVYSAVFDKSYSLIRQVEAEILETDSYADYLEKGPVYFIGNGVEKTKTLIQHENAHFIEDKLPSAYEMSQIAYSKYQKSDIEDVAYFEPYYLKDFIALKPKAK